MRFAVVLVVAAVLAGCAGNGGDPPDNTTTTTTAPTPTASVTPTNIIVQTTSMEAPNPFKPRPTPTASPTPTPTPPAPPAASIVIADFAFSPANQTAAPGATVTWNNTGSTSHSVVANDGAFASDVLAPGAQFSVVLDAGTYAYKCGIHPSMTGIVTVA